jgi:hypothetical protein
LDPRSLKSREEELELELSFARFGDLLRAFAKVFEVIGR